MTVVTPEFIEGIIRSESFTLAQARARAGTACPKNQAHWEKFSTWTLICEEVLDTEHDADWYDDVLAELTRRGFSHEQINRMRIFAWQTAGWLNFDMMLWEWVSMDEKHIRRALDWQLEKRLISPLQHTDRVYYIENPSLIPA
ncbi:hypothetical protein [Prosthecobacter sp.]|uniref:hypothetical protein n=1 Tax=Prosthecobacter sp. TaxID=1965333 RepID=UPI0037845991